MYIHIHIYTYETVWFVCSMCQTYWAHVFPIGCARHHVSACNQIGSSVRLPTLFPALLPTLAHLTVLVCTHWHVGVPVLWNCGARNLFKLLLSQPVR